MINDVTTQAGSLWIKTKM